MRAHRDVAVWIAVAVAVAAVGLGCRPTSRRAFTLAADTTFLPPGIAVAELPDRDSPGGRLVAQYCSQCHGIPSPASHSAADWEPTLRRMLVHLERGAHMGGMGGMMGRRMGARMQVAVPTDDERRTILVYLQAHGLRAIAREDLPEAGSEASALFARTCSRCHSLPSPGQHAAAEWPAVVSRMRGNMRRFGVDTISDAAAQEIIAYLQRVAGGSRAVGAAGSPAAVKTPDPSVPTSGSPTR